MKDDTNGTYSIYTFSRYIGEEGHYDGDNWIVTSPSQPASARNKYTIPSEGTALLDKAISIFFSNRNLLLYVTTTDGIYTINYGLVVLPLFRQQLNILHNPEKLLRKPKCINKDYIITIVI